MPWEKQFDVDAALDRAMEGFWSRGYAASSTQDLLGRMGINRGSLYDTFGSKRALFLAALRRYEAAYQRPKIAADTTARSMNRNPAVTIPSSSVTIPSLNSSGASVLPATLQWTKCRTISTLTSASVPARRRL